MSKDDPRISVRFSLPTSVLEAMDRRAKSLRIKRNEYVKTLIVWDLDKGIDAPFVQTAETSQSNSHNSPVQNALLSQLARFATDEDWAIVRQIVTGKEKKRQCYLAYAKCKSLGLRFIRARAARTLGVNERTVRRWMKEFATRLT